MPDGVLYEMSATLDFERISADQLSWAVKDGTPTDSSCQILKYDTGTDPNCVIHYVIPSGATGTTAAMPHISLDSGETYSAMSVPLGGAKQYQCIDLTRAVSGRYWGLFFETGGADAIYYSDDVGATWTLSYSPGGTSLQNLRTIEAHPSKEGYVVVGCDTAGNATILRTTDGATWVPCIHGGIWGTRTWCFWGANDRILFIGGASNVVLGTSDDYGSTVTLRYFPTSDLGIEIRRIGGPTTQTHFAITNVSTPKLSLTTDNGTTWANVTLPFSPTSILAQAYDSIGDDLYVAFSAATNRLYKTHAPASMNPAAPVWSLVLAPTQNSISTRSMVCLTPGVTPPPSPPGGGGGGPPRFGPFHPTHIQTFQRNVLLNHKPKAIG